ncbi:hypothetical protein, partial [Gluconobacter cerinus]
QISYTIMEMYEFLKTRDDCKKNWPIFIDKIEQWFGQASYDIVHYIPCILVPDYAQTFFLGPVQFVHIKDIFDGSQGLPHGPLPEANRETLRRALEENSACWVAKVEITKCLEYRSLELANLAVDIAIGALKLVVTRKDGGSGMARATARTLSKWDGSVALYAPGRAKGLTERSAGNFLSGHEFSKYLFESKQFIINAGASISAFISGKDPLSNLRQAWCDSVYWYHEGTSEHLTTVSVVKLETAIEALLRTKSSRGSEERIKSIIKKITGLDSTDMAPDPIGKTVKEYVKSLVAARSRILHGTLSPLIDDAEEEEEHLIWLSRKLLLIFSHSVGQYSKEINAIDCIDEYLIWLESNKHNITFY